MGHAAGDLDQALDAAEALGEGEDGGALAEALGGGGAPPDAEAEHAAPHAVAMLSPGDGALRVRRQPRVVDGNDVRGGGQRGGHEGGVMRGFARAQVQRFEPPVREPAVEGGGNGADGVLEEGETRVEGRGVERCGAHEDILPEMRVSGVVGVHGEKKRRSIGV